MRTHEPCWKLHATTGRTIVICVLGMWTLLATLLRVSHGGADQTQAAPSTASFRGRLVTDWVAELRKGPVDALVAAGPEALPVWEQAARDPEAVTWVDHCLQVHFPDAPWTARVFLAMLDSPGSSHRSVALLHLQSNATLRQDAASQVVQKAREWAAEWRRSGSASRGGCCPFSLGLRARARRYDRPGARRVVSCARPDVHALATVGRIGFTRPGRRRYIHRPPSRKRRGGPGCLWLPAARRRRDDPRAGAGQRRRGRHAAPTGRIDHGHGHLWQRVC